MGSFEELLESAGYLREDSAVGAISESHRPIDDEIERLYEEVAAEADVESDALLLEFAPLAGVEEGEPRLRVSLWYDGELTRAERLRVVEALRRRFQSALAPTEGSPKLGA